MTFFESLILGIVQGITEFFPVSSSTHMALFEKWLKIPSSDQLLYFHLSCHLGTTFALLIYLRKKIYELLFSFQAWKTFFLALLPLPFFYLLFKHFLPLLSHLPPSYCLFITSLLLLIATKCPEEKSTLLPKPKEALWIGFFQGFALLPGISRSGATISAARFLKLDWKSSVLFSFLLSIPTILGGEILETIQLLKTFHSCKVLNLASLTTGLISSFVVGLAILPLSFQIYEKKKILPFALYCAFLALFLTLFQ